MGGPFQRGESRRCFEDFGEFVDGGFDQAFADLAVALAGVTQGAGGGVGVEGVGPLQLQFLERLQHGHEGFVQGAEGQRVLADEIGRQVVVVGAFHLAGVAAGDLAGDVLEDRIVTQV